MDKMLRQAYRPIKYTLLGRAARQIYHWWYNILDTCWLLVMKIPGLPQDRTCTICGSNSRFFSRRLGATYFKCLKCNFVQSSYYDGKSLYEEFYEDDVYTAPRTGGRRELFFVEWLTKILTLKNPRILIFAPATSPTFKILSEQGADVYAADISDHLPYSDRFIHLKKSKLPEVKFDIITMVEVIEHFDNPVKEFSFLREHLAQDGAIAGTTDFYPGGATWNKSYLNAKGGHISYFHHDSLIHLCDLLGLECVLFEIEWGHRDKAAKDRRAFFVYRKTSDAVWRAITQQVQDCPILPIQEP